MVNLTKEEMEAIQYAQPLPRERQPNRSKAKTLQGKVWLDNILCTHRLSLAEFSNKFVEKETSSPNSLIYKWSSGETTPTLKTVMRISKNFQDARTLYDLPLWELLENRPLKQSTLNSLIAPYWNPKYCRIFGHWSLPTDDDQKARGRHQNILGKFNSDSLMQRGDTYGFMAIVAGVRESEAAGDGRQHCFSCIDMYRALPAVLKIPWFSKNSKLLVDCMDSIRRRVWGSEIAFDVDWAVIERQVKDPNFETMRHLRPRDPKTFRYIDLEDPIRLNF